MSLLEAAAYVAYMVMILLIPMVVLDWILGVFYRRCRWFQRKLNKFFRSLPQW